LQSTFALILKRHTHLAFCGIRAEECSNPVAIDQATMIERNMIATAYELPGYRIERSVEVARGIIVRSRSIVGVLGASLQTIFGGKLSLYTSLYERARQDACERMLAQAEGLGANGIIGMRYDATEIARGLTEVLCYGTAVHATSLH
jgi:uncharacterized protein YbjQ (UPF0145 family)